MATDLARFIDDQVLPGTGVEPEAFWKGFDAIVDDLAPKNLALLAERDRLQTELDAWHPANPGPIKNMAQYRAFLEKIGYLVPVPAKVQVTTTNVDAELALQAGPQLVVPILNARYALNAANARWGSLYDALYGTDVFPRTTAPKGQRLQPGARRQGHRLRAPCARPRAPLAKGSHIDATGYRVAATPGGDAERRQARRPEERHRQPLARPAQFVGYQGEPDAPSSVLLRTTACTSTSRSTAAPRSARATRPAVATWCWKPRCPPSWTWKTRWPWSTPTTRCWPTATGSAS